MAEPARLLDVTATAAYLGGVCTDSVRALVARGDLVPVRLPSTRRPGESSRRLLFAREDLDVLVDRWKRTSTAVPNAQLSAASVKGWAAVAEPVLERQGRGMTAVISTPTTIAGQVAYLLSRGRPLRFRDVDDIQRTYFLVPLMLLAGSGLFVMPDVTVEYFNTFDEAATWADNDIERRHHEGTLTTMLIAASEKVRGH